MEPGPLPDDWQQEPPEDPYAGGPESNAWEQAEPPADVYSSGNLSDSEWAATNWAGTGSSPARTAGSAPGGPGNVGSTASPSAAGPAQPGMQPGRAQTPSATPALVQTAPAPSSSAAPAPAQPQAQRPAASPAAGHGPGNDGRPLSRYQKLLNEAAARSGSANPSPGRSAVNSVEDIPSADDIRLEDSGLVGRKAIERILGGRLIEERSLDGR